MKIRHIIVATLLALSVASCSTKQTPIDRLTQLSEQLDKSDAKYDFADVYIFALNKENLQALKDMLFDRAIGGGIDLNGDFLCEERHYNALLNARQKLTQALDGIGVVTLDVLAIDIKDGWDALGEISGRTATEDIINNIFSKFCVGK